MSGKPQEQIIQNTYISFIGAKVGIREEDGNPLQYSYLVNSMDGPWGHKGSATTERLTQPNTKLVLAEKLHLFILPGTIGHSEKCLKV